MKIGGKQFDFNNHAYVMGILNVTPDSFSDGGRYQGLDAALQQAEQMIAAGADILDIGGESTRPGHEKISNQEEIDRVIPVIEAVKQRFDIVVSLDTYKGQVAQVGITAGVDMINDIWGLKWDAELADIVAKANVPICIMHNGEIREILTMDHVLQELQESIAIAEHAGILKDNIMLDPGVGFGKTYEQNLLVLKELKRLQELGFPVLLGTSRKSVVGLTLDLPVNQREEGTLVTTVHGYLSGARLFRVHDVQGNVRALRMIEAIERV